VSTPDRRGFDLEQGGTELAPWFADVTLRRYDDALIITEVAPLVAYYQSMGALAVLGASAAGDFTRFLEQELAAHGAIRITKDTGLFLARR
jgi:hypothetical protein